MRLKGSFEEMNKAHGKVAGGGGNCSINNVLFRSLLNECFHSAGIQHGTQLALNNEYEQRTQGQKDIFPDLEIL